MSNSICVSYADLISISPATDISNVAFESVALSPAQFMITLLVVMLLVSVTASGRRTGLSLAIRL